MTRFAVALKRLGFARAIWIVSSGFPVVPVSAQACVGTVDAPAGAVCGLAIEAPPTTKRDL